MTEKIRFYVGVVLSAVLALGILFTVVGVISKSSQARTVIGIHAVDGYEEELQSAMDIWNGFIGCKFLVHGSETIVKSDDGQPCGDAIRPENEWGHAATTYQCPDGTFQILITKPGNDNTQACYIAHEIGHRLQKWGVFHSSQGVMGKCSDPNSTAVNYIRISDRDSSVLREFFCE